MKLVIIVPDGMCDWRYPELGNRSPAEAAYMPGLDEVVRRGQVGLAQTLYPGLPMGSLVGMLGLYGYNPIDNFPLCRSIFEASAMGLPMSPGDLVCRCNVVCVNAEGVLLDFTAGQITDLEAQAFLSTVALPPGIEIHHDLSYRNVLIYRDWSLVEGDLYLYEPHENEGRLVAEILPTYQGQPYQPFIDLMLGSNRDKHMLWPWGPGRLHQFPPLPFRSMTVCGMSFLYGMARAFGGSAIIPPGTNGYITTDLDAKLRAAMQHLPEVDMLLIHCNAPDEESHIRSISTKIWAIEDIDRKVIVPMLRHLDRLGEPYRLLVIPDHYTVVGTGRHVLEPVAYAVCGMGLQPNHSLPGYSEVGIQMTNPPVVEGHTLASALLKA